MAIARVQITPTGYTHVGATVAATLGALPTNGNALVATVYDCDNGVIGLEARAGWAAGGWSFVEGGEPGGVVSYAAIAWRASVQADRDAAGVITVPTRAGFNPQWNDVYLFVAEYSGFGGPPALDAGNSGSATDGSSSAVIPTITPQAGKNRLIVANASLNPNYLPGTPGTWTKVKEENVPGNRQTMQYYEKLIASTLGSYGGDTIGPAGVGAETNWWIPIVALGLGASSPPPLLGGSPGGGVL